MQDSVLLTGNGIEHQPCTTFGMMYDHRRQPHGRLAVIPNDLHFKIFVFPPLAAADLDKQSAKPQISAKPCLDRQTMFVQQQLTLDWFANTASMLHVILL
jgi:hypothetical protein